MWFSITTLTGLFGVAFYLLAITSEEKPEPGRGSQIDNRIKKYTPMVVAGAAIGLLTGFIIVFGAYSTLPGIRRPEPYYWVILYLGLIGAGVAPVTYFNKKHRLVGYNTGE
jgi:drug/metabolite transporter (DMT)-like permease